MTDAGREGLTLHEARHTAESLFIASGMSAKTVSTFMGPRTSASPSTATGTFPGAEDEARGLLDAYLEHHDG